MNLKRVLKIAMSLLCATSLLGCATLVNKITPERGEEVTKRKETTLTLEDTTEDLHILDDVIGDKRIFFTGETHGNYANAQLEIKFTKYFKENTGFKYLLSEDSYSGTYYLNKYLVTGDESYLGMIFDTLEGTFAYTKDRYKYYQNLYAYNQTLPEEQRISVIGVDLEHQPFLSITYLREKLEGKSSSNNALSDTIKSIEGIDIQGYEYDVLSQAAQEWLDSMTKHEDAFKELLGDDYKGFKHVITNSINIYTAKNAENWNLTRDKFIYSNFLNLTEGFDQDIKYFGQWGLNHIYQHQEGDILWFATYLTQEYSPYHNKVLSIAYDYQDCQFMSKKKGKYGTRTVKNKDSALGVKVTKDSDIILYPLVAEELDYINGEEDLGKVSDYVQWVVNIRNQKATTPFNQ